MDGFEGLAAAIALAMLCMLLVPTGLLATLGYVALRKKQRGWAGAVGGALLGLAIGGGAIAYTFYWETLSRTELVLEVPERFAHESVILIEDPTGSATLAWERGVADRATLRVPTSGVVRVQSLEGILGQDVEARLAGGPTNVSSMSRPAPAGLGGDYLLIYGFVPYGSGTEEDFSMMEDDALVARVLAREAE